MQSDRHVYVYVANYMRVYQIMQRPPEENYHEEGKQDMPALDETWGI